MGWEPSRVWLCPCTSAQRLGENRSGRRGKLCPVPGELTPPHSAGPPRTRSVIFPASGAISNENVWVLLVGMGPEDWKGSQRHPATLEPDVTTNHVPRLRVTCSPFLKDAYPGRTSARKL